VQVTLICPLCRAVVVDGEEPSGGACPGCAARYAGGGDDARGGVAAAIAAWGIAGIDADRAGEGLFRLMPDDPLSVQVTVTSDRRDGFYRWWVFVADGVDAATALAAAAAHVS
jgi:hypothetical protein